MSIFPHRLTLECQRTVDRDLSPGPGAIDPPRPGVRPPRPYVFPGPGDCGGQRLSENVGRSLLPFPVL